jgi:hypothetical protein
VTYWLGSELQRDATRFKRLGHQEGLPPTAFSGPAVFKLIDRQVRHLLMCGQSEVVGCDALGVPSIDDWRLAAMGRSTVKIF